MSFFKHLIKSIIIGSLIIILVLIFIYFTQGYVSNYNVLAASAGHFLDITIDTTGPIYVIIIIYLTGLLAQFFSQNLNLNNL